MDLPEDITPRIIEKAKRLGVSAAGAGWVDRLLASPSHRTSGIHDAPPEFHSFLVLAVAHPASEPSLDWWDEKKGGTPGNRRLIRLAEDMSSWMGRAFRIRARPLPYMADPGGVFLKDAAVLAGLGILGRNNLLITPEHGPRIRLRALWVDAALEPTPPPEQFDPCGSCPGPCLPACPQGAFAGDAYSRHNCNVQMKLDELEASTPSHPEGKPPAEIRVRYCRACELSCPVGEPAG